MHTMNSLRNVFWNLDLNNSYGLHWFKIWSSLAWFCLAVQILFQKKSSGTKWMMQFNYWRAWNACITVLVTKNLFFLFYVDKLQFSSFVLCLYLVVWIEKAATWVLEEFGGSTCKLIVQLMRQAYLISLFFFGFGCWKALEDSWLLAL